MLRFHAEHNALATIAVQNRKTSRYLLFDEQGELCGRRAGLDGPVEQIRPAGALHAFGFSGIHVVSPRIFASMPGQGAFSIIDAYLRLAANREKIVAFPADGSYWRDLGRPESVSLAEQELAAPADQAPRPDLV
jgi:NDP-sugar pyrophosphorylase family protein